MDKIAFVFSGQGAQYPGMGKEIMEAYPAAKDVFERLEAKKPGLMRLCFDSTKEELMETRNTQPAMFAVETATAAVLDSMGIKADAAAGFSLGEMAALVYSGVVTLEEGFELVSERGRLMQAEAEKHKAAMSAVLKLSAEQVEALASKVEGVYPVNYNCPGQVVVSGTVEALPGFEALVKENGGRAMRLSVGGGFHSPFMKDAAALFGKELEKHQFSTPSLPIYSNATGAVYGSDMKATLSRQIDSPVRWEMIVRAMIESSIGTFIEIGPGSTLTGLIRKIDSSVRTFNAADRNGIEAIREGL